MLQLSVLPQRSDYLHNTSAHKLRKPTRKLYARGTGQDVKQRAV